MENCENIFTIIISTQVFPLVKKKKPIYIHGIARFRVLLSHIAGVEMHIPTIGKCTTETIVCYIKEDKMLY